MSKTHTPEVHEVPPFVVRHLEHKLYVLSRQCPYWHRRLLADLMRKQADALDDECGEAGR
ncbi:hypothetical protein Mal64_35100 [Pseudobythopirellula maris]|uniref:Uncharacterized protein n=1 Tax=Pseudobythopirellula maris TaxID=2527991 RepID=A0A5C5ZIP5_9BACT|nr:hypothetical protein Mal64_35100 [Pseudobythopirellula maris]